MTNCLRRILVLSILLLPVLGQSASASNTAVNLSGYYNVDGIATGGSAPKSGGFNGDGYAYNSSQLGTSLSYNGLGFPLGPANGLDAVDSATVPVAAGQYNQLYLLGAGVNGAQTNQTVVITYTDGSNSTFEQNFSDWANPQNYPGETVVSQTGSVIGPYGQYTYAAVNVYGYSFNLTSGKTPQSVKLPNNRNVVFLGIGWGYAPDTVVNLSSYYNIYGIATVGNAPKHSGLDGDGFAYNSSLLGTSLSYNGVAFPLGPANAPDAVDSVTIPVAAGQYNQLYLLGNGVNGAQTNQTVVVTYTDGSSSTFEQNFSDWAYPQNYTGETIVAQTPSRIGSPYGQPASPAVNVYGYSFNLTSGKTPESVKLPNNRNVVFLGIAWTDAAAVNLSSYYNIYGIATLGNAPKHSGLDGDGFAYNSSLLGTSVSYNGLAFPIGPANAPDAVDSVTIPVAAGQYNQLYLLGNGVNGAQTNQTVVVTYTDGSSSTFEQNFSDWAYPQNYTGETIVAQTPSRIGSPYGQVASPAVNLYGYSFNLTSGKTPESVELPNNRNVVFLAMGFGYVPTTGAPSGTFTLVQHVHNAACASSTTCAITLNQSIAAGDLLIFESSMYPASVMTATNNGGTFEQCVSCVGFDPTNYLEETSGGWILSASAQASPITVTFNALASGEMEMWEYSYTGGTPGFDGANQNETQNSASPAAFPFKPSGSNDISVQACRADELCDSVSSPFTSDNTGNYYAWAYLANATSFTAPTWTLASSGTSQLTQMEFGFGVSPCANTTFVDFGGANGSAISQAQLALGTHGWQGGYWTINGTAADLTFETAASQGLQNSTGRLCDGGTYTDSSTTGLQYSTANPQTYLQMNGTNGMLTGTSVSAGTWYYSTLPSTVTSQTDNLAIFGTGGQDYVLLHEFNDGGGRLAEIECGSGTSSENVALAPSTWYWVEIVYNTTGNHTMKIYNNANPPVQMGSTMTCPSKGTEQPAYVTIGNVNSDSTLPSGYIFYYDGLKISLDGTDPLLP